MSMLAKTIDMVLMAPHKHLDADGNSPHASKIVNFFENPTHKVIGLAVAAFALSASAQSDKKHKLVDIGVGSAFGAATVYYIRKRTALPTALYFDTKPEIDARPPPPPEIMQYAVKTASTSGGLLTGILISGAFVGFDGATGMATVAIAAEGAARLWRVRQVGKGNWTASLTPPPSKEEKREYSPGRPAPSAV